MNLEKKINIVVIIFIIILVGGVISLVMYQKYKYKDIYFKYNNFDVHKKNTGNGVFYYIKMFLGDNPQAYMINVRYDPRTLENIPVENNLNELKRAILKKDLYLSFDKGTTGVSILAGLEISGITGNQRLYNIPTHGSMFDPIEGKNITVKNCDDVNDKIGVIWLKLGDETKIHSVNDCIIIEGTDEYELIRGADRFILTLLEIMKP